MKHSIFTAFKLTHCRLTFELREGGRGESTTSDNDSYNLWSGYRILVGGRGRGVLIRTAEGGSFVWVEGIFSGKVLKYIEVLKNGAF